MAQNKTETIFNKQNVIANVKYFTVYEIVQTMQHRDTNNGYSIFKTALLNCILEVKLYLSFVKKLNHLKEIVLLFNVGLAFFITF